MNKVGTSQVLMNNPTADLPIDSRWLQYFILLSAPLLTVIDVFIVNISIPSIKKSLEATDAQVQLIIASYLLGYASFMITGGRAGDFWGRKKVFMWGMLAFIVTSCFCGMSENANLLIIARFLQGISGAFMTPQALSYLQVLFPDKTGRTNAIGYLGITLGIASTLGQFLGGYFSSVETVMDGWRLIFFINLPIGLIALWASGRYLKEIKIVARGKFDILGVLLIIIALATLIYPLTEGRELGWPWWSFALIALSFAFFYLFIITQKRKMLQKSEPLIDLELFRIRSFNKGLLAAAAYFMVHTSYLLISTIYIQNGLQIKPFQTGLLFVAFGVSFMLSSFLSIRLVNRYGKLPVQMGLILMVVCYIIQLNLFDAYATHQLLYIVLFITGFAGGLVLPTLINLTLSEVPKQFTGAASGVYNTVQQAASSIGICLVGGIFFYTFFEEGNYIMAFHTAIYGEIVLLILVLILITSSSKPKIA